MANLIFIVVMVGFFWLVLIRPQQKRMKEHQALVASASAGDRVLMNSGVYGTITEVLKTAMYVEIAEGIEILVDKQQIQSIPDEFPTDEAPQDAVEEDA